MNRTFHARAVPLAGLAGLAALVLAGTAIAQPKDNAAAPAPQPADAPHGERRAADPESIARFREAFAKRLEARRREIDAALKMLAEGKAIDDIRAAFPDLARFGGGQRGDGDGWPRGNMGSGPMGNDDPNRLGAAPGERGERNARDNRSEPRVLTEDDRTTVRDVLTATAGPEFVARLRDLEKAEPAKADQQYARSLDRMRSLIDLRKRDPQMFGLKARDIRHGFEAGALARSIGDLDRQSGGAGGAPDTAARQDKVERLRAALLGQYNVRTQIMQRDIDRSGEKAAEMAREVQKRPAQAADVVDKNLRDMLDREHRRRERGEGARREHDKPAEPLIKH